MGAAAARTRSDAIVCLTTIPSRLPHVHNTLKSLLNQTLPPREIRLHLPAFSQREGVPYVVPPFLKGLASIRILRCEDAGPATKFLPALTTLPADQAVVVVDDDRIYPPNFLQDLDNAARTNPDAAFGFSGWIVPDDLVDRPTTMLANLLQRPPAPVRAKPLSNSAAMCGVAARSSTRAANASSRRATIAGSVAGEATSGGIGAGSVVSMTRIVAAVAGSCARIKSMR